MPIVINAFPCFTTPVPTAAAALSPAPPTTGVPGCNPVSFAASPVIAPVTSQDSYSLPSIDWSISSLFKISSDHVRAGISIRFIPDASLTSVANSPVSI